MRIKLSSIMVENQTTALTFYTDVLGFNKSKESTQEARCQVHGGPEAAGAGEACDIFRYLRQSDPDVPAASEESLISHSVLIGFRPGKLLGELSANRK